MAKIHRSDAPLPQAPSVQVKASYTVTELPKVSPQEPAAFYDQDNDEDYRRRETAKCIKKRGNLLYTLAMIVFAAIFLISGGLLLKRFLDDRKTESEFADLQSMIDTAATPAPAGENVNPNGARFAALRDKNSDFIGWISIDGGEVTVNAEQDGLQAESALQVPDGTLNVTAGGGSVNAEAHGRGDWGGFSGGVGGGDRKTPPDGNSAQSDSGANASADSAASGSKS